MADAKRDNGHPNPTDSPGAPPPTRERPALSIVIPAYNEAARLPRTLACIRGYLATRRDMSCEVIVVDDGSRDGTLQSVADFRSEPLSTRVFDYPQNRGKGYAVRCGVHGAHGQAVLICDADLSTPIEEIEKLLPWLDRGYDVVIGSRDLPDSVLDPPQGIVRRWMAWAFRAIRRRFLLPELRDTQCGFKLFRDAAARRVFGEQTVDGWLFDCEVLGLADRFGYRIKEVGVIWRHHPHSRVKPLREAFLALPALWRICRRLATIAAAPSSTAPRSDAQPPST